MSLSKAPSATPSLTAPLRKKTMRERLSEINHLHNKLDDKTLTTADEIVDGGGLKAVLDAFERKDYAGAIKSLIALAFSNKGHIDGAGFDFSEKFTNLSPSERVVLLDQLRAINVGGNSREKLRLTLLRSHARYQLAAAGFVGGKPQGVDGEPIKVKARQTLKDIVDAQVWQQIKNGDIVGGLQFTGALPVGSFVYFSKLADGRRVPIFVGATRAERPTATLFARDDAPAAVKKRPTNAREYLVGQMQVGDIIVVNGNAAGSGTENIGRRVLQNMTQRVAAANNNAGIPWTHVAVYIGDGKVAHIDSKRERRTESVDNLLGRVSAAAILNPPSAVNRAKLAARAKTNAAAAGDYGTGTAIARGVQLVSGGSGQLSALSSVAGALGGGDICTDITRGVSGLDLPTPAAFFTALSAREVAEF